MFNFRKKKKIFTEVIFKEKVKGKKSWGTLEPTKIKIYSNIGLVRLVSKPLNKIRYFPISNILLIKQQEQIGSSKIKTEQVSGY